MADVTAAAATSAARSAKAGSSAARASAASTVDLAAVSRRNSSSRVAPGGRSFPTRRSLALICEVVRCLSDKVKATWPDTPPADADAAESGPDPDGSE